MQRVLAAVEASSADGSSWQGVAPSAAAKNSISTSTSTSQERTR